MRINAHSAPDTSSSEPNIQLDPHSASDGEIIGRDGLRRRFPSLTSRERTEETQLGTSEVEPLLSRVEEGASAFDGIEEGLEMGGGMEELAKAVLA